MRNVTYTKLKLLFFIILTSITCLSSSYIVVGVICILSIFIIFLIKIYHEYRSEISLCKQNRSFISLGMISSLSTFDTLQQELTNLIYWFYLKVFLKIGNTISKITIYQIISSILSIRGFVPYLKLLVVIFTLKLFSTKNISLSLFETLKAFTAIILSILIFKITKFIDLIYAIDSTLTPLKKVGINSEKITLLLVLTFRFFFMLRDIYTEILYAQKARGVESYKLSLIIPFILRALKKSQYITEAILVR